MTSIDIQPTLIGKTIQVRPLVQNDFESLLTVAADPKIWELHPDSERYKRDIFSTRYFEGAIHSGGALAIEELGTGKIIGSSRYYEWRFATKEISIGYTFIERVHWGMGTNSELKSLMLHHIYQWADIVWFHVGKTNLRSRRAVEKLGAVLSHQQERELDGNQFVQLYYKLESSQYRA